MNNLTVDRKVLRDDRIIQKLRITFENDLGEKITLDLQNLGIEDKIDKKELELVLEQLLLIGRNIIFCLDKDKKFAKALFASLAQVHRRACDINSEKIPPIKDYWSSNYKNYKKGKGKR